jgi:hypothetical protein
MTNTTTTTTTFNGHKNWETWNVVLWLMNDEFNYEIVKACKSYEQVMMIKMGESTTTPDGAAWDAHDLDYIALDELVYETN